MTAAAVSCMLSIPILALDVRTTAAFVPGLVVNSNLSRDAIKDFEHLRLFSTPPGGRPQPRRNLKKRRRSDKRKKTGGTSISEDNFPWDTAESRPLVQSRSIEAGQDYWIDEDDLKKSLEREAAIKNRKEMEGEIPIEKLKEEVVAPYTQNWIGLFSVFIVILATIVTKFPELLNTPVIPIPDL